MDSTKIIVTERHITQIIEVSCYIKMFSFELIPKEADQ